MVTCPNCGTSVRAGQRFCGNCGTDIQAALSASTPRPSETPDMPYAYPQAQGYGQQGPGYGSSGAPQTGGYGPAQGYGHSGSYGYGYESQPLGGIPPGRWIIIGAALLLAVCCAFACGLVFGFEIIPDVLGLGAAAGATPTIRPTVTPTPASFLPLWHLIMG